MCAPLSTRLPSALLFLCILHTAVGSGVVFTGATCAEDPEMAAVDITVPHSILLHAYSKGFRLSDGSRMTLHEEKESNTTSATDTVNYMRDMLRNMRVDSEDHSSGTPGQPRSVVFHLCGDDIMQLFIFGMIGNFVTDPTDQSLSTQVSSESVASVVIDVYTNKLILVNSFNIIRTYFLETLLVISIIAIARLALVRNVTKIVPNPEYSRASDVEKEMRKGVAALSNNEHHTLSASPAKHQQPPGSP